ncbi:MAG: class I SAM-dependent methyltransferase [Pyrinomonadaceae bacterium]
MAANKTDKELAFINDLFVAPDWGERFSSLIDEHVQLPREGDGLYVESGTGGHAMALQERAGRNLRFIGTDENAEAVELARAKAKAANEAIDFRHDRLENLALKDNQFKLVIGNGSLVATQRIPGMLREMLRVAKPGAMVALVLPTASSFAEFFSIYWEALHNSGLVEQEGDVERLITQLPTISEVEEMAEREGLVEIVSSTQVEEFDYDSGETFLNSPLISEFLMSGWLASVPESLKKRVSQEIACIINEERHAAEFALTVKATLIVGRKARSG